MLPFSVTDADGLLPGRGAEQATHLVSSLRLLIIHVSHSQEEEDGANRAAKEDLSSWVPVPDLGVLQAIQDNDSPVFDTIHESHSQEFGAGANLDAKELSAGDEVTKLIFSVEWFGLLSSDLVILVDVALIPELFLLMLFKTSSTLPDKRGRGCFTVGAGGRGLMSDGPEAAL